MDMDKDTEFRELYRKLIEQYELSPEIADAVFRRILRILSGDTDGCGQGASDGESEVCDK